jgi:ribose transport system permease protein
MATRPQTEPPVPLADPAAVPTTARRAGRSPVEVLRDSAVFVSLVVLFALLSVFAENFLTAQNLENVLDQAVGLGIIATAGTLVIIAGGFDLSVGATFAMSGVVAAEVGSRVDPVLGLVCGLLCGVVVGLLNAVVVSGVRINPFIATLATSIVVRGLALALTGGALITVTDEAFAWPGTTEVAGLGLPTWILLAWAGAMGFLLWRTAFGRYIRACGGNEEAARLSGIRVGLVRGATLVISGLAAALAGVLAASEVATGQADAGVGLELTAVAAIVVGGTSIWGGEGAVWRTVVGVLLLALIGNGFNLLGIDPVYQQVVFGGEMVVDGAPLHPRPLGDRADGGVRAPDGAVQLDGSLGDPSPRLLLALRPPLEVVLPALHRPTPKRIFIFFPLSPLTRTRASIIIHDV